MFCSNPTGDTADPIAELPAIDRRPRREAMADVTLCDIRDLILCEERIRLWTVGADIDQGLGRKTVYRILM